MTPKERRQYLAQIRNAFMLGIIALGMIAYVAVCFIAILRLALV